MRTSVLVSLLFVVCTSLCAADDFKPFDVKLGLWETTTTFQSSGMPPVSIPPDALARMTPDQRAKVEAMMKGQGSARTTTTKSCMTPEKMKRSEFYEQKQCTKDVVTSTGSKLELRMHCTMEGGAKADGTVRVERINLESTRGSVQIVSTSADHTMNMNSTFTSKWLGPDCGDVK